MTEAEWLNSTDPRAMLSFLRYCGTASDRKLRLWACACVRRVWHFLTDEWNREAVEVAEQYADGRATARELAFARDAQGTWRRASNAGRSAEAVASRTAAEIASYVTGHDPWKAANEAALTASWFVARAAADRVGPAAPNVLRRRIGEEATGKTAERKTQAALLRDIFDNPFRQFPAIDAAWVAWNDGTVKKMAEAIYEERAFDRMPVLADALEDAGCTDKDVLAHCREQGKVHVRGCFVLDLLLDKG